jgi:predicted O-linked N-acetylglucosamine transferase (SPINDLY family)
MGVPTVTLAGSHYVSRMSTAVLAGAGLSDWIASDAHSYVALAQRQAAGVAALRANRAQWRQQLQASPLGDAADLMVHLEEAFSAMHAQVLSRL